MVENARHVGARAGLEVADVYRVEVHGPEVAYSNR